MKKILALTAVLLLLVVSMGPGIADTHGQNETPDTVSQVTGETTGAEPSPPPPFLPPANKKPNADAGPNQKSWTNRTVYFNGSKSEDLDGTIESYEWDFGDGAIASGVAVEHEYSESGQYNVTLTVRDDRWSYDSDTCKIKVSDPPTNVSAEFSDRVRERERHVVDAMDEANTVVTLNTTDDVTVTVLRYEDNPHPGDPIPAMALPNYIDVEVSDPDAVIWPIYVEMFYTDEEVGLPGRPGVLDESTFGIYYWMDGAWQRCSHTGVDTERNVVWAYMTAEEAAGSPILIAGMHAIPTPPLPPFLDNLNITPAEIERGDNVTISFDIMNTDSQSIDYIVKMRIENVNDPPPTWPPYNVTLTMYIELEAYESKTISRTLTMDTVGDFNVTVLHWLTGSFKVGTWPPLRPAEFVVSGLTITLEEVELLVIEDWFKITANVTNIGEQEGTHTVDLKVDGEVVDWRTVKLKGGEETTIIYDVARGVGSYTVEVDGLTGSFTVKAAEFVVSDLEVDSDRVAKGEVVTITVEVKNIGGKEGTHTVLFEVDGLVTEMAEVTLDGGESTTVSFTITEVAGDHTVGVEDLTGDFTVTAPGISPGYVAVIIIVIIATAAIFYAYWKRILPILYPEIDD